MEPEVSLPPASWSDLVRPAVFTVTFTGGTIAAGAIWQYENMRKEALKTRMLGFGWNVGEQRR